MKKSQLRKKRGFKNKSGFKKKQSTLKSKKEWKKRQKQQRNKYKAKNRKRPETEYQKEVKKLDRIVSMLVRISHADDNGYCDCYTCGYTGFWKKDGIQCGHFYSRSRMGTRFDLRNVRPQCNKCNTHLSGNMSVYAKKLKKELNEDSWEGLRVRANEVRKYSVGELKALRKKLTKRLKNIRNSKTL